MNLEKGVGLSFANYNFAFTSFYDQYQAMCFAISEKTELKDLIAIRKRISTFIYENQYTIMDHSKRKMYRNMLLSLKRKADKDQELKAALTKDLDYTTNKIHYRRKYYEYFKEYLILVGIFVSELTTTYMPSTTIQRKLLRFSNNQMFFQKFTEHKEKVLDTLSEFDIRNFTESFNKLVTFYFAYSMFINEGEKLTLDKMFSYALTYYLSSDNLSLLSKDELTYDQKIAISKRESFLHRILLFCLSSMNQSFSNYDVLPKLQTKVFMDKTLI